MIVNADNDLLLAAFSVGDLSWFDDADRLTVFDSDSSSEFLADILKSTNPNHPYVLIQGWDGRTLINAGYWPFHRRLKILAKIIKPG